MDNRSNDEIMADIFDMNDDDIEHAREARANLEKAVAY